MLPPPDRQGLPRSLCFLECMPFHITPEGHTVALASFFTVCDRVQSLRQFPHLRLHDDALLDSLHAAAYILPRTSQFFVTGLQLSLPVKLQGELAITLADTFQSAGISLTDMG